MLFTKSQEIDLNLSKTPWTEGTTNETFVKSRNHDFIKPCDIVNNNFLYDGSIGFPENQDLKNS